MANAIMRPLASRNRMQKPALAAQRDPARAARDLVLNRRRHHHVVVEDDRHAVADVLAGEVLEVARARRVELKVHLGVEKNFAPARKAHPAFIVDDLAALTSALVQAGFPISHDEPLEGYDRIFVHDPFGNRIELMEIKTS